MGFLSVGRPPPEIVQTAWIASRSLLYSTETYINLPGGQPFQSHAYRTLIQWSLLMEGAALAAAGTPVRLRLLQRKFQKMMRKTKSSLYDTTKNSTLSRFNIISHFS